MIFRLLLLLLLLLRVSQSFLRFGHLELFAKRKEMKELIQLIDFVCFREYPHLLKITSDNNNNEVLNICNYYYNFCYNNENSNK